MGRGAYSGLMMEAPRLPPPHVLHGWQTLSASLSPALPR